MLVAVATGATLPAAEASLYEGFRNPSRGYGPETYFHLQGGNVTKEGLDADLKALADAGVSGIQLFHGTGGTLPGVKKQIPCLSADWDGMIRHVADVCGNFGLKFTMQVCPGWSMAGGPWIAPSNAMRTIVWRRIDAEGGRRVNVKLPNPCGNPKPQQDYRDIAVLAFPTPAGDWERPLLPVSATCNIPCDMAAWLKNPVHAPMPGYISGRDTWTPQEKGWKPICVPSNTAVTIRFTFAKPVTIRTVELPFVKSLNHRWCFEPQTKFRFEAKGRVLMERDVPSSNWSDSRPLSVAIDEIETDELSVALECRHEMYLNVIRFWSSARNDDWEAQAGWTLRRLMHSREAVQDKSAWVYSSSVTNLTHAMRPDGTLSWDAPPGKWAFFRIGHVNTCRMNQPAPKNATGFECDKFSPRGADAQFDGYVGRLVKSGVRIDGLLMDSWECGWQTWTDGMDAMFEAKYGYGLLQQFPALFGYVLDNPSRTAVFLNDWREFTGDLISENFYGRMAKRARDNGMTVTYETACGDVITGDILKYWKHADRPMCEFWFPHSECGLGSIDFKPVKPAVSAARIYGKRGVGAEAFTAARLTWDEKLRDFKHLANIHLADGVTHLVFHTFAHNPLPDSPPPGMTFGGTIGSPFSRKQTWWPFLKDFNVFLARCGTMLEEGVSVRDVLWYLGDEIDHKPPQKAPFPDGVQYDYCNRDALMTRITVNAAGEWTVPEGTSWRVLWIPSRGRMKPETLAKILDGAKKGGIVAFADGVRLKEGSNIHIGKPLEAVLEAHGIRPDVTARRGIVWNHRRSGKLDWYFVAPEVEGVGFKGEVTFRVGRAGRPRPAAAEIWHPESGKREMAEAVRTADGTTTLMLDLAPAQSVFVVFDGRDARPAHLRSRGTRDPTSNVEVVISDWTLSFPAGWDAPQSIRLEALKPWKDLGLGEAAGAFSGTAEYSTAFEMDAIDHAASYMLDLGRVESAASVELNGKPIGNLWSWPYRIDVTGVIRKGRNELKVKVANTWFNRLAFDAKRPVKERRTWTTGGWPKNVEYRDSGLLGPVRLIVSVNQR